MKTRSPEKYKEYLAECKAKAAAKAIAEGRIPGQMGQPSKFTEDERREKRRIKTAKWREANREKSRKITRDSMKRKSDAKADALGRPRGKMGKMPKILTPEQKREKQNARVKKWYAKNLDAAREIGAVAARNRRARIKGNGGTHTVADIKQLFFEQKGMCGLCDLPLEANNFHVDHWKPLSKGGSNDKSNLKLLHPKCNLMKHDKLPPEFKIAINS